MGRLNVKKFKKRFWTNLAWLQDGGSPIEIYLYNTKIEAITTSDVPHEIAQVVIQEL